MNFSQSVIADDLRLEIKAATPWLQETPLERAKHRGRAEAWSAKEILGHLIDSASNNHQRFVRAQVPGHLESGTLIFPKYDQRAWVDAQGYQEACWYLLIKLWRSYNLRLSHVIQRIPDDVLGTRCRIGEESAVTLAWLCTDYLEHMRHHLRQLQAIAERKL